MAKKKLSSETILTYTLLGEAAGEGPAGMAAVAHVLRNRSETGTAAGMASQALRRNQFSFWNGGQSAALNWINQNTSAADVAEARAIVRAVIAGTIPDPTGGAVNYFANKGPNAIPAPGKWGAKVVANGVQIGNHIFGAQTTPTIDAASLATALSAARVGAPLPATMSAETRMARYMEAGRRLAASQPTIGGGLITRTVQTVPTRAPTASILRTNDAVATDRMIDLMSTRNFWSPAGGTPAVSGVARRLLAEQLNVQPLRPGDPQPNLLPDAMPPLPRPRPNIAAGTAVAAPSVQTVPAPQPRTARMTSGREVEIGRTYNIGGIQYVGGVNAEGVGTLTRVPYNILDEAGSNTIVGGIIREQIAQGVSEAKVSAQETVPLLAGEAAKNVGGLASAAVEGVGNFFGGLFGGGAPAPRPSATEVLQSIHDRRETSGSIITPPPSASWLPFPPSQPASSVAAPATATLQSIHDRRETQAVAATVSRAPTAPVAGLRLPVAPTPVTPSAAIRAGAAVPATITRTITVPRTIQVENPEWGRVSPEAIARLQDIHDREEARRMQAQIPQFITQTIQERRVIRVPNPAAVPSAVQPAAVPGTRAPSVPQTVLGTAGGYIYEQQADGTYKRLRRDPNYVPKVNNYGAGGFTSSGQSKTLPSGESWAAGTPVSATGGGPAGGGSYGGGAS